MSEKVPNPDFMNTKMVWAFMTKDGCYHREGDKWYQFRGVYSDGVGIWREVDESEVPESFKTGIWQ